MKQHVCGLNKKNKYGRYKKTILINLDYYDSVGENELIYDEDFRIKKYNKCIYNNIKIIYINLAYLEHKYYNEEELNEFEKIIKERFEKDKKRFAKTKKDFERDKKELIKNKKELM